MSCIGEDKSKCIKAIMFKSIFMFVLSENIFLWFMSQQNSPVNMSGQTFASQNLKFGR